MPRGGVDGISGGALSVRGIGAMCTFAPGGWLTVRGITASAAIGAGGNSDTADGCDGRCEVSPALIGPEMGVSPVIFTVGATRGSTVPMRPPQWPQNRESGSLSVPHEGQRIPRPG
jgi:hypothetical protein